ncbi:MAG: hypothetical protein WCD33_11460 [Mycobacterium sp.]|uniref:hypothetical protein n=1 Tax=Mycobacterium sp. TaxID=1785 RepID=UPI003C764BA4
MKSLLEFFLKYFDFLYLNRRYHITDSRTTGAETINASLTVTGPTISWQVTNDRGQILFHLAPTKLATPENWFRASIIRQHLDGFDERNAISPVEAVAWMRDNISRIEELFSDSSAARSCKELTALENANADKYWGPSSGN